MSSPTPTWWAWRHERGGSLRARRRAEQPAPLDPTTREGRFSFSDDHTPSSTPISSPRSRPTCACARRARASFLLESVEQGRLGRLLARRLRRPARLASRRPSGSTSRSSATSATTTSRSSSRPCRCPDAGPDLPESRFVVADVLVRFDHVHGHRRGARTATRTRSPRCSRRRCRRPAGAAAAGGADRALPGSRRARAAASSRARSTSARGDAFQIVLSQRAERRTTVVAARALPRAAPRQPVAVSLPARARRRRARRLVAGDARQASRARARQPQPDRRHDRAAAKATRSGCSPPRRTAPST